MRGKIVVSALAVVAAALTAMGTGHVASPIAAVAGVFVWLRFLGHVRWPIGLVIFTGLTTAAWELAYSGTVPMAVFPRLATMAAFSLVFGFAFLTHIWVIRKWHSLAATIVLPCAWVIIEFASANLSPTGSWGSLAYSFGRWLPVAQIASITGWVGVTFFGVWIAALTDWVVLRGSPTRTAARAAALGIATVILVVAFGWWRISSAPSADREVGVVAMHGPTVDEVDGGDILRAHYLGWDSEHTETAQQPGLAVTYRDQMFTETAEAMGSAELIVWSETLVWMSYDEEPDWIERGRAFARENRVMIAMGMSVFDPQGERLYLNKSVLIDDRGEILWEFLKARPIPGARHVVGNGVLPVVDTRVGRVGGAICYDMDFPSLLHQAGRSGTELFLAPSFDDKRVRWMHARMAVMRAIEQGFTMIRPTAFGISVVADPFGRRLFEKDAFAGGGFVMHATVPVLRVDTIYTRVGDVFAWACIAAFVVIVLVAFNSKSGSRSKPLAT